MGRLVFKSESEELLPREAWAGDTTVKGSPSLYEYTTGESKEPRLVGVRNQYMLRSNTEAELISSCGTSLGANTGEKQGALSQDGRTVIFTGQANIAKVKVGLPQQLPSRLTTLQKACPDATFNVNPASCPAASVVGMAAALTPVLRSRLSGPAYLVSHAGASFPDLVIVLQGEGVTLDLVGNTDIKKGITSSTFNAVPDAPFSTFDLILPAGPHSALGANLPARAKRSLCRQSLAMPTLITGQNGAVLRETTKIAVWGCPRHAGRDAKSTTRHRRKR
jgi:hypothetical protein